MFPMPPIDPGGGHERTLLYALSQSGSSGFWITWGCFLRGFFISRSFIFACDFIISLVRFHG
jgi:hypothetical protein